MTKRIVLTAVVALAVLGAIFGYKFLTVQKAMAAMKNRPAPVVTVATVTARTDTWTDTLDAVGALASFRGITVKSEIEGVVRRVAFESGTAVAEGAPLVEIDDSVEQARLLGLEAQARLAEANLARAQELRANNTNTPADLDAAEASRAQALANIAELKANIAKKHIVAPFAGRLGIAQVYPGQFLNKGDALVLLETIDPIYVDFSLPQQASAQVADGLAVRVTLDAFPGRTTEGKVTAISPRLSDTTRSLRLRATLPNADETLRPGMFAHVALLQPTAQKFVVLPATALVSNPYGDFVYVVEAPPAGGAAPVARQRFVTPGARRGDFVAVLKGVNAGEEVVFAGQMKLRPGAAVKVDNTVVPSASASPRPNES